MSLSTSRLLPALLGGALIVCGCQSSMSVPTSPLDATRQMQALRTGDGAVTSPATSKLKVTPTSMVFKRHKSQQAYMSPNTDQYTETDTCKGIATAKYFSYGIWTITPGTKNGLCAFTFKDTVNGGTAKMKVANKSN